MVRERFGSILDAYDTLLSEVAELRDGVAGTLRVGFIYYGGMSYMREGLDRFYASFPTLASSSSPSNPMTLLQD